MSFFKKILGGFGKAFGGGGGGMGGYQPGPNPAGAAMPYLDQIPGAVQPYYQPFIESGRAAEGMANPIYERMASNPNAFIENLMQGYTPSRGYQFKQREMERAMRNAAGHGGFVGTPYDQQQQAELIQGLLGQDMQQFLSNLFGAQGAGLEGLERRTGRGYEASRGYGDILGSNLLSQANNAYGGQLQQNQLGADIYSNRLNAQNARRNAKLGFFGNLLGAGATLYDKRR